MKAFPRGPEFTLGSFARVALRITSIRLPGPGLRNRKFEPSTSSEVVRVPGLARCQLPRLKSSVSCELIHFLASLFSCLRFILFCFPLSSLGKQSSFAFP